MCEYSVGNPNLDVVESHVVCLNQVLEGTNFLRTLPSIPSDPLNPVTNYPIEIELSSLGNFHIKGFYPNKMARVQSVLTSMNVKAVKFHQNILPSGSNKAKVLDKVYFR